MGVMALRKLVRLIEKNGYVYDHSRGGHDYYVKGSRTVPVPQHGKDVEDPLLGEILSETGIKRPR